MRHTCSSGAGVGYRARLVLWDGPYLGRHYLGRHCLGRHCLGRRLLEQFGTELIRARRDSQAMKVPRATSAVVTASVAGGAFTLLVAVWRQSASGHVDESQWIVAAAVGALALGSWVWPVVVQRGGESAAFNMDEVFFVILALLVPPLVTLGTFALATVLAQVARRRSLAKSAFNAGQVLVAAGLGLAVSRSIAAPSNPLAAGQIAAIVLGVGVYFVINTSLVACVVVSMGATWGESTDDLPIQMTRTGAGALIGVILALAIQAHLWAVVLAIPGLVVERRLISARFAAQHAHARMKGLYEVTLEANRGLRQRAVLETILGSVRRLLRSPEVILASDGPSPGQLAAPMTVAGKPRWLVASGRRRDEPFDDADRGLLKALAAVGSAALRNAELYQQVHAERERLSSITLSIGEGVCAISADGRLTFVNRAATDMIELPSLSIATDDVVRDSALVAPDFLLIPAREAMRTGRTIREDDARFRDKDGGTIPVAYTASAVMSDGTASGAVIAFRDITERKAFEDKLHQHAFYDSLTGLANRRLLVERLDQALLRSALDRKTHALIFVDVDRFKSINDSLGHVTGDEFLVVIAARMKAVVRSLDLLARFSGDEFVVLLEDVAGADVAVAAARRICAAVEQAMVLSDGHEVVASVSVGIALTEPGKTADDVLRNADVAMYAAKAKGGGGIYRVFDQSSMGSRSSKRLEIETDLRKGLERDELEVHYQPFYSLDDQHVVGAEALVRWRHPTGGLISPMRFIPIAEETGLIQPLGRYVLDKACRQVCSIRQRLDVDLPISVNLSPRQFQESGLPSQVAAALEATGLPSELLMFEITESMVMEDLSDAREIMKKLSRLGVRLAIDDFGTGHSSLAYLQQFPVHEVKIDRTFVQGIAESSVDLAIVRAVIDLANAMGISAVAEGVETKDQLAGLRTLGCQVGQGFYFSHPLRAEEFDELLTRQFARTARPYCVPSLDDEAGGNGRQESVDARLRAPG
jgi:diguanylate cyclase (GGDEF)-like protein/PAS domain S-box-containing protein